MKWVDYMKKNSFVLKHRSGKSNKVANALGRRRILLIEKRVDVLIFDDFKNLYETDLVFTNSLKACKNHIVDEQDKWVYYFI